MIRLKKGLNLPITGEPIQRLEEGRAVKTVALLGPDYVGMKPTMHVKVGDKVKKGQPVFTCKKVAGVVYTAPAAGTIIEINRGDRRVFQSLVIQLDGNPEEQVTFKNFSQKRTSELNRQEVVDLLLESGLWPALRTRPYSKAPAIDSSPASLFITAADSNPLSADPAIAINEHREDFRRGIEVLTKLAPKTFFCRTGGVPAPVEGIENIEVHDFAGPHPVGNAGTHIHFLDPVHINKTVWYIGYQDVIAVGRLFLSGKLFSERVVSLAGPHALNPRLVRTRLGACLDDLTKEEAREGEARVISGSPLHGHKASGPFCYLGRFHNQVSILKEGRQREFLGWQGPGWHKFSIKPTYASSITPWKKFPMDTNIQGSERAMVPVGSFEKVMPLDILPTQLLRALVTKDTDLAQQLGCLELDEEDLALCTFAAPGKVDFGPILRENLTIIEKEG